MTMYRLRAGAKYGDMKPGDEIELSEAGAAALANKFEPIVLTPDDQLRIKQQLAADRAFQFAMDDAHTAKTMVGPELDPVSWDDLLDGSVGTVNIQVEKMKSAERLRGLIDAEKQGKNRSGVLKAATKRLEELESSAE